MSKKIKESVKRELIESTASATAARITPEITKMFDNITMQHRQLLTRMRDIENLLSGAYTARPKQKQLPDAQKSLPSVVNAPGLNAAPAELKPATAVASHFQEIVKKKRGRPRKDGSTTAIPKPVKFPEPTNKLVKKDQIPAGFETINGYLSRHKVDFNKEQNLVFSNKCRKIVRQKGLSTQIQVDIGYGIVRNCYTTEVLDQALKTILDERGALPAVPVNPTALKREQARRVLAL